MRRGQKPARALRLPRRRGDEDDVLELTDRVNDDARSRTSQGLDDFPI